MIWTESQRKGLLLVLTLLIATATVILALNPVHIPDPAPDPPTSTLADRIDPNTADAPTLSALPNLGPKRAAEIVAHRAREQAKHPTVPVFKEPKDLESVHGIGPATVESWTPYLIFPTTRPSVP